MKFFIFTKKQMRHVIIFMLTLLIFSTIFYISFDTSQHYASGDELSNTLDETTSDPFRKLCRNSEKIAYLTFDDGPTTKVTPKILDILEKMQVPASFFVVGKHVVERPDLIKQAFDQGHFIANHGYSHNNRKMYQSIDTFLKEVSDTDQAIANALGVPSYHSHLFRFPNGSMSKPYSSSKKQAIKKLKEMNYSYIDWNCLNHDSIKKYSNTGLLENLKKSAKNKGTLVILMHDTGDVNRTYDVLEDSITYLQSQGYEFRNFYDFIDVDSLF